MLAEANIFPKQVSIQWKRVLGEICRFCGWGKKRAGRGGLPGGWDAPKGLLGGLEGDVLFGGVPVLDEVGEEGGAFVEADKAALADAGVVMSAVRPLPVVV